MSARNCAQVASDGGFGTGGAGGSTAFAAFRAISGSLAIRASAPARVAALTGARASNVNGTTRRPFAWASAISSWLTGHCGEIQSMSLASATAAAMPLTFWKVRNDVSLSSK